MENYSEKDKNLQLFILKLVNFGYFLPNFVIFSCKNFKMDNEELGCNQDFKFYSLLH